VYPGLPVCLKSSIGVPSRTPWPPGYSDLLYMPCVCASVTFSLLSLRSMTTFHGYLMVPVRSMTPAMITLPAYCVRLRFMTTVHDCKRQCVLHRLGCKRQCVAVLCYCHKHGLFVLQRLGCRLACPAAATRMHSPVRCRPVLLPQARP
jgi:hypothetical protein